MEAARIACEQHAAWIPPVPIYFDTRVLLVSYGFSFRFVDQSEDVSASIFAHAAKAGTLGAKEDHGGAGS